MKLLSIFSTLAFCAFTVSNGCKKAAKPTTPHFLSATITGGPAFNAEDSLLNADENKATPDPYLLIRGYSLSGACLSLWIYSYSTTTGTTALDGINAGGTYSSGPSDMVNTSVYGTLTITSTSPLTGTFAFTKADSTHVAGSFNVAAPL